MSETFDKSQMSETIDVPAGCIRQMTTKASNEGDTQRPQRVVRNMYPTIIGQLSRRLWIS